MEKEPRQALVKVNRRFAVSWGECMTVRCWNKDEEEMAGGVSPCRGWSYE
ncbi:MAG: hypothetical protein MUO27_09510 [Sedimentisphaerales bacterium]|nr:hypothetical protein [Sedimentisphaerales bacterium]